MTAADKIKEGNELIALFMGFKFIVKDYHGINILENDEGIAYDMYQLKYHKSWDWLMPVAEKIGIPPLISFKDEENLEYGCIIDSHNVGFIEAYSFNSSIEAVWKAILIYLKKKNGQ